MFWYFVFFVNISCRNLEYFKIWRNALMKGILRCSFFRISKNFVNCLSTLVFCNLWGKKTGYVSELIGTSAVTCGLSENLCWLFSVATSDYSTCFLPIVCTDLLSISFLLALISDNYTIPTYDGLNRCLF